MTDFELIDSLFGRLIKRLKEAFSESEMHYAIEFYDHGEYGLALESVISLYIKEQKNTPKDVFILIEQLTTLMELPIADYSGRLKVE